MNEVSKPEPPEDRVSVITDALAGLLARVWGFEAWAQCAKEAETDASEQDSGSKGSEKGPAA